MSKKIVKIENDLLHNFIAAGFISDSVKFLHNECPNILNPINPGLEKEIFIEKLQNNIYKEIDLIN